MAGGGRRGDGRRRSDHARRRAHDPGPPQRLRTRSRRSPSALLFGIAPDAIRRAAAAFGGSSIGSSRSASSTASASSTTRMGTQPDAVDRRAARVRAADRADRRRTRQGRDLAGLAPVVAERAVAAVLIGESGPTLESTVPVGRARANRARRRRSRKRSSEPIAIARGAPGRRRSSARRPSCSARRPPASTCSPTTPPAAGPSRRRGGAGRIARGSARTRGGPSDGRTTGCGGTRRGVLRDPSRRRRPVERRPVARSGELRRERTSPTTRSSSRSSRWRRSGS